ncbi:DNA replication protein [Enterococcus sp. PF1-24]|uniref:DnaD domain-containing protein n=1 Tax=unclassified Enterococcus TaxID=2608891 RepID=UPI0024755D0C|nr:MULTISPECIES: DnaD domain protein [unclassified Enterococcus]MDH6365159.1 DNA replication protein [Enterococcus sp. PFB1-1]MDH6402257.1 DNA replication protein [Enterococcus sp. PF1-24]
MDRFFAYINAGQISVSNLLLANYSKLGLTNEEMMLWLQLVRKNMQGDNFPDLVSLATEMGITQDRVYLLLEQLLEKQAITINSGVNEQGQQNDYYDLSQIYSQLALLLETQEKEQVQQTQATAEQSLYQSFEAEFGRPLSPMEYQQIGQWIDDDEYSVDLIILALREAVLNQAYSLKYVDRVLLSWERKNITTKAQVQAEQQKRKEILLQKEEKFVPQKDLPKVSLYNWLDEGEKKGD